MKILVASAHEDIRRSLNTLFDETSDIAVAGEANDGDEALQLLLNYRYDVVLLDISLPKKSGVHLLKELQSMEWAPKAIILSTFSEKHIDYIPPDARASAHSTEQGVADDLAGIIRNICSKDRSFATSPTFSFVKFPEII